MSTLLATDYKAVYSAWRSFRKGKRPTFAIDQYAYNVEANLSSLAAQLSAGTYRYGSYQRIVLREKKRRDLAVAGVRDRVVHRLLYDHLVEVYDSVFDADVWSCRKQKGLHKCLGRTQQLLRVHPYSYVWRADITKFFDSVNHQKLMECLEHKIKPADPTLGFCKEVIRSYQIKGAGIPIGNLTSQIFANIYLHEFDRFIRHQVKPQAYLRYGDDFIMFFQTRRQAFAAHGQSSSLLKKELSLKVNPKNDVIVPAADGLKFLGHLITGDFAVVDARTTKDILAKVSHCNIASYRSMPLPEPAKKQLDWIVLKEFDFL